MLRAALVATGAAVVVAAGALVSQGWATSSSGGAPAASARSVSAAATPRSPVPAQVASSLDDAQPLPPSAVQSQIAAQLATVVASAQRDMTYTEYNHTRKVDAAAGRYAFDCVGMTDYFLSRAAPGANADMRAQQGISKGRYPSPERMVSFFSQLPAQGSATWLPVAGPADLRPGDVIAVGPTSSVPGHAMIVAQQPVPGANGSVTVVVFDSTSSPHGTGDSRPGDPRAQVNSAGKRSGLGYGTVRLAGSGGDVALFWTASSTKQYGETVRLARPLV